MATVGIEDLFENDRFPGGLAFVAVCLYFPIGVVLMLLRIFIGFHTYLVSCILPKMSTLRRVVLRSMCTVLGIIVTQEGREHRDKNAKVLVANYTSTLDHLAVNLVTPSILPCVWDLPPTLMWLLGYTDMGAKQGREVLIQNAKKHTRESQVPMLVFPEGASTSGKVGLLKFSVWPFSLDQPVQPLLIQIRRPPFARIAPSVIGGRWWIDVLWYLFVPYTCFHLRLLPVVSEEENETTEEFTVRVQGLLAKELCIAATPHTSADKVEYAKRKFLIRPSQANQGGTYSPSPSTSSGMSDDHSIEVMTLQVQEVLPHVPVLAIKRDLALTKDVDLTITNLLEGRAQYSTDDPVREPEQSRPAWPSLSASSSASTQQPPKANTAAPVFAKKSSERHMSLEERKRALLETARQRYIAKHGLNI